MAILNLFASKSVESFLRSGVTAVSNAATQIPKVGTKLSKANERLTAATAKPWREYQAQFIKNKDCPAYVFNSNIKKLANYFNQPKTLIFDSENVYIENN